LSYKTVDTPRQPLYDTSVMSDLQLLAVFTIVALGGISFFRGGSFTMLVIVVLLGACVGLILRCADG